MSYAMQARAILSLSFFRSFLLIRSNKKNSKNARNFNRNTTFVEATNCACHWCVFVIAFPIFHMCCELSSRQSFLATQNANWCTENTMRSYWVPVMHPFVWQIIIDVFDDAPTHTQTQTHYPKHKRLKFQYENLFIPFDIIYGMAWHFDCIFLVAKPFDCQFIRFSSKCLLSGFYCESQIGRAY